MGDTVLLDIERNPVELMLVSETRVDCPLPDPLPESSTRGAALLEIAIGDVTRTDEPAVNVDD